MKKVEIQNNFSLIEVEPEKFLLMPQKKEDLDYLRILYTENSEDIFAIDPPGGPFISIGTKINGINGNISDIYFENSLIYIKFNDGKQNL